MTINGSRGINKKIKDRFDLTLECIRRFYLQEVSPLYETLSRYESYFELFRDFKGYAKFFLLQDLLTENLEEVNFVLPFDNFNSSPLPKSSDEYLIYLNRMTSFVEKRNNRILEFNNN